MERTGLRCCDADRDVGETSRFVEFAGSLEMQRSQSEKLQDLHASDGICHDSASDSACPFLPILRVVRFLQQRAEQLVAQSYVRIECLSHDVRRISAPLMGAGCSNPDAM